MSTLAALRTEIIDIIQDPGVTPTEIDALINRGILYIASNVLLADLEVSNTVDSELASSLIPIPSEWDFHRNLISVYIEENNQIEVVHSIEHLSRVYPTYETDKQTGCVTVAALNRNNLVIYPIPDEVKELICYYHRKPETLVNDVDEPSCIPIGFQEELIINYVCYNIFRRIEDGVDGRKVNSTFYFSMFKENLIALENSIQTGQSRAVHGSRSNWV